MKERRGSGEEGYHRSRQEVMLLVEGGAYGRSRGWATHGSAGEEDRKKRKEKKKEKRK